MDYKAKIVEILDKNINQQQLVKDLVVMMVLPLIEEFVQKTPNKIDDMVVAELIKYIESKI